MKSDVSGRLKYKGSQSRQIEITNPFLELKGYSPSEMRWRNALNIQHSAVNIRCRRQKICNMLFEWLKRDARHALRSISLLIITLIVGDCVCVSRLCGTGKLKMNLWKLKMAPEFRSFCMHLCLCRCFSLCSSLVHALARSHLQLLYFVAARYQLSSTRQRHNQTKSLSISALLSHSIAAVA